MKCIITFFRRLLCRHENSYRFVRFLSQGTDGKGEYKMALWCCEKCGKTKVKKWYVHRITEDGHPAQDAGVVDGKDFIHKED